MKKTLLIGVGAPKCGTSWLHHYLWAHPQVFMCPLKEMSYFNRDFRRDVFTDDWDAIFRRRAEGMAALVAKEPSPTRRKHFRALNARVQMASDPNAYLDYFRTESAPEHMVVGEITPGYCTLRADGFRTMREQDCDVKIVYLMRDPVDRYWSALRMRKRDWGLDLNEEFKSSLESIELRTYARYDLTLIALDKVFPPENIWIDFYETLFSRERIEKLCAWLGIRFVAPDFERRANASPPVWLSPERAARLRLMLSPVYAYCRERFGPDLPAAWRTQSPGRVSVAPRPRVEAR